MAIRIEKDFGGVVFTPKKEEVYDNGGGVLYPRVVELHHSGNMNGVLLATFDHYTKKEPPVSLIYASYDHGKTWEYYSEVSDSKNGYGIRFQPDLFELPINCGDLKAGTLLFTGNSVPLSFKSTELQLYVSTDHGKTWTYRSSFAYGGRPIEQNFKELGPVWEPFIYINKYNQITIAFTDERPHTDRKFNQTLALVTSNDGGKTWNDQIFVAKVPNGDLRPGMPIVTKLPNGKYFMCYEIVGLPCCDIYFKISDDGVDFGDPSDMGIRAETSDGQYLGSMPYCIWVPQGGKNGTIILSAHRDGDKMGYREHGNLLVNYNLGQGPWETAPMLVSYDARMIQCGWSMGMCTIENDTKLIQLAPVQTDPRMLQIAYGIANLSTID